MSIWRDLKRGTVIVGSDWYDEDWDDADPPEPDFADGDEP
jgi:hypothetical protein